MKNFFKIFLIFVLLGSIFLYPDKAFSEEGTATIYFFDDRLCPVCRDAKEFLQHIEKDYVEVELIIYHISDIERLKEVAKKHGVENYKLVAPSIFIGNNFFQFKEFTSQEEEMIIIAIKEIITEREEIKMTTEEIEKEKEAEMKNEIERMEEEIVEVKENLEKTMKELETLLEKETEKKDVITDKDIATEKDIVTDKDTIIEKEPEEAEKRKKELIKVLEEYKKEPSEIIKEERREEVQEIIKELSVIEKLEEVDIEDPREEGIALPNIFKITEIFVSETFIREDGREDIKSITIKGKGPPNTTIFIYIFSTPIIVTVKTDSNGMWSYTLDKELEDGSHEIYVASVDNTGKVIAKSNPFFFIKEAAAITEVMPTHTITEKGFFQRNLFLILLSSLILIILSGIVLIGVRKKDISK